MIREQFEAWISSPPFEKSVERQGEHSAWPGHYRDYGVQLAWCAWEDSAKSERESCATVCEELYQGGNAPEDAGVAWCVEAIRARSTT